MRPAGVPIGIPISAKIGHSSDGVRVTEHSDSGCMVVATNWMLDNSDPGSDTDAHGLQVGVLFDRLLDAVVTARLSPGRIGSWNPAAEKLFGYPAAEAIGQSIEILMPEPITEIHRAGLERYRRSGHGLIVDAGS